MGRIEHPWLMHMKRALLIGVPGDGLPAGDVARTLDTLKKLLQEPLGFQVLCCTGSGTTREVILSNLSKLAKLTKPGDTCLVYYFGHGGRVHFEDLDEQPTEHEFGYITTTKGKRDTDASEFTGILDFELSRLLSRIPCDNINVIIDSCYSAELVRAPNDEQEQREQNEPAKLERPPLRFKKQVKQPQWARKALAQPAPELALDSSSQIVRLCGSSSRRSAFLSRAPGTKIGNLTGALIDIVVGAGARWNHMTWDTIVHRLRELTFVEVGTETQWVALAGPRQRRLFSTEVAPLPGTVAISPDIDDASIWWLRAGWHQGVHCGDRWAVIDVALGDEFEPLVLTHATVIEVQRNRARVELDRQLPPTPGYPGYMERAKHQLGVASTAPVVREMVERSAWLRNSEGADTIRVSSSTDRVEVAGDGQTLAAEFNASKLAEAIALLEQRARERALMLSLAAQTQSDDSLAWSWFRVSATGAREPLRISGETLRVGERIGFDFQGRKKGQGAKCWFVSVILRDPAGSLTLLNARTPEGIELPQKSVSEIGFRWGRTVQGVPLRWPGVCEGTNRGPAKLLVLAAQRPMCLAHIVSPQGIDDHGLRLGGANYEHERRPLLASVFTWDVIEFQLDGALVPRD